MKPGPRIDYYTKTSTTEEILRIGSIVIFIAFSIPIAIIQTVFEWLDTPVRR